MRRIVSRVLLPSLMVGSFLFVGFLGVVTVAGGQVAHGGLGVLWAIGGFVFWGHDACSVLISEVQRWRGREPS